MGNVGSVHFRNGCEHDITAWLVAGPAVDLGPGSDKRVGTELIWYSARAKGPGPKVDEGFWAGWRNELNEELKRVPTSDEEVKLHALVTSIRAGVMAMYDVFNQVPTTVVDDGDQRMIYVGSHMEGVYGGDGPNIRITSRKLKDKEYDPVSRKYVTLYDLKMTY